MEIARILAILVVAAGLMVLPAQALAGPVGTAFTYQGRLMDANEAADGEYDFQFKLYDSPADGNQLGSTIDVNELVLIDGYFTVELDLGSVFDGSACYLEIDVRPGELEDPNGYDTLSPRQQLTPTPYALYAASVGTLPVPLELTGSSPDPIISGTNSGAGSGVYGEASDTGNIKNYGGHFKAAGKYGRAVYGEGTGESSRGVLGETSGKYGIGVQGTATGDNTYGVYGFTSGSSGRGVRGIANNSGDVENYGGHFSASGASGRGVYGEATKSGDYTNYGGYFKAAGDWGRGVYGLVTGTNGSGVYGQASGIASVGVCGVSNGMVECVGVYGKASGSEGRGVEGYGSEYDFYASGPGYNYGSSSSIRWKSDIRSIDEPLEKVMNLRGVYFSWDAEHGGHHDVGMVAEEVGEVLPEIVSYEKNGIDATGMDYSKLTPLLVEAVKELKTEMNHLQKENAELRARLVKLETMDSKPSRF